MTETSVTGVDERLDDLVEIVARIDHRLKLLEDGYRNWSALPDEDIVTWRKRWDVELLGGIRTAVSVVERVEQLERRVDEAIGRLEAAAPEAEEEAPEDEEEVDDA
jgi:hypothetical protein